MESRLKIIVPLFLLLLPAANLFFPREVLALGTHCPTGAIQTEIGKICTDPQGLVLDILSVALGVAGGVALLLMLFGGGMYVFSSGNPEKTEEAQKILTAAISGALLIFFSIFLLKFVGVDLLAIPGLKGPGGIISTP